MARSQNPVPSYRRHKRSGLAVVTIRLADGKRKDIYLGPWKSPESRQEYIRIIGEIQSSPLRLSQSLSSEQPDRTVNECLLPFLEHCETYYRHPDGTPTGHTEIVKLALKPVRERYAHTPAREFGPIALRSIQQYWIAKGTSRGAINKYISLVRQFFRWCLSHELIPAATYESLKSLAGLKRGRSKAQEMPPVQPADEKVLEATIAHMPPMVAALVQLQSLCAARGGELLTLKAEEIDRSGSVWIYTPALHKNAYRGKARQIYFGPKGQDVLSPWLAQAPAGEFVFNPYRGEASRLVERSEARKTPRYRSHMNRNKVKRKKARVRQPGDKYTATSYNRAVARACEKAFPLPEHLAKSAKESNQAWKDRLGDKGLAEVKVWREKHSFSPHQLRHLAATKIRKEYGIELSRILLGHSDIGTTQIYAEVDAQKAMDAASKIG